jgi:hypothetical protein
VTLLGIGATLSSASGAVPDPSLSTPDGEAQTQPGTWPSGDELRRDLQEIGFTFRFDAEEGDWMGWVPRASSGEPAALRLAGTGTDDAAVAFEVALLRGDPLTASVDVGVTLTALFEVTARLPIGRADAERLRRFVLDDLLGEPPDLLEPCYVTDWPRGAVLVALAGEDPLARLGIASARESLRPEAELDLAACAPLVPSQVAAQLGDPSTVRLTITLRDDGTVGFDPAVVDVEGALVTLVLTFRNESAVPGSLTFEAPLTSTTGSVDPGEVRLIVVRQLPPGEYAFRSETDPERLRGVVRIRAPVLEDE